jgi:hypothetical protein
MLGALALSVLALQLLAAQRFGGGVTFPHCTQRMFPPA